MALFQLLLKLVQIASNQRQHLADAVLKLQSDQHLGNLVGDGCVLLLQVMAGAHNALGGAAKLIDDLRNHALRIREGQGVLFGVVA